MMHRKAWLLLPLAILASCGGEGPVSGQASNIIGEVGDTTSASGDETVPARSVVAASDTDGVIEPNGREAQIPLALHGRWGMTPADCTSTRGDAKGLLRVSGDRLRFFESVGRPESGIAITNNSISGTFSFTGEGQTWTREQALQIQGSNLSRTESDPRASFTYVRCD